MLSITANITPGSNDREHESCMRAMSSRELTRVQTLTPVWLPTPMHSHRPSNSVIDFVSVQHGSKFIESFTRLLRTPANAHAWSLNLVWPRAWESNKTPIQIWSLNSHTTLILVWPRAWELDNLVTQLSHNSHTRLTTRMRVEQNSHPNLVAQLSHNSHPRLTARLRVE